MGRSESEKLLDGLSIDILQAGGTALYDTLIEVASRVRTRSDAIIVISDGEENASDHSSDATVSILLRSSSRLPVFALIPDYDREHARSRAYFKKIPAETGGLVEYPTSASKGSGSDGEMNGYCLDIVLGHFTTVTTDHQDGQA